MKLNQLLGSTFLLQQQPERLSVDKGSSEVNICHPGVRVIGKPLASPIAIGWPAYRVVGKRLALVSKTAGQHTKRIFEALLAYEQNGGIHGMSDNTCC